jgi:hypothetical protein
MNGLKNMNILNKLLLIAAAVVLLQCQRDRDKYYDKPSWAGDPIYEVLEAAGGFSLYLQMVDRSTHVDNFRGNGYWTVFAPNDEAVKAYLSQKGYASVAEIPTEEVEKIVAYSMLFTRYEFNRLSDILKGGWDTLKSIKKKTPYYETLYKEYYKGDSVWVTNPTMLNGINTSDNNYKYLPLYLSRSFGKEPSDYETFYPRGYTGRNVQGASVSDVPNRYDMNAANGIVH